MDKIRIRKIAGFFWLIVSCLCWAANYLVARLMMTETQMTPSSVTFWRYFGALPFLFLAGCIVSGRGSFFAVRSSDWLPMFGQGVVLSLVSLTLFWCERFQSASNSAMIDALIPIAVMLGGLLIGEHLRLLPVAGMGISFCGALFILRVISPSGLQFSVLSWSDLLIPVSAAAWAGYVIWGRGTVRRMASLPYTFWTLAGCTVSVGLYSFFDGRMLLLPRTAEGWGLLAWMVFVPTIGALWAWNQASRVLSLPIQNIVQYQIPVFAVLMAHFFLNESLSLFQVIGILLICGGLMLEVVRKKETAP